MEVTCAALSCTRCVSTCFVISVSSGLRLQRVYVTCVTLSCVRFEPNVFQNVLEVQRKILKADQVEGQIRLDIEPQSKPVEAGLLEVNLTFVSGQQVACVEKS